MHAPTGQFSNYVATLTEALNAVEVSGAGGSSTSVDAGIAEAHRLLRKLAGTSNKVMFIGNGGSAGIAGHMAIDFAKNGGIRSLTFNDASSLTCLGNDLGYDQVFAKQVEMQALAGDVLIAISSSGQSANILRAAEAAKAKSCAIITLSGFSPDNTLRRMGALNFYVGTRVYGFVETAHQTILHAILDMAMGWSAGAPHTQPTASAI